MNNTIFPKECQSQIHNLRIGIQGQGLPVDVAIANFAGLGVQTIYVKDNAPEKRLFREEFLQSRYPQLIYVEDDVNNTNFKEENDLEHIININPTKDSLTESIQAIIQIDEIRKDIYTFDDSERKLQDKVQIPKSLAKNDNPKKILAIGAGGIGNYFALGIKESDHQVRLVDNDTFDASNLNRQIFAEIGKNKAETIAKYIPNIQGIPEQFNKELISQFQKENYIPDIIIGCVDNFETRNALIQYSKEINTPYFDGGVDTSTGRINLNPEYFKISTTKKTKKESTSCAVIKNPSVVIPNAIIGVQLARCIGDIATYNFKFDTLHPDRILQEVNENYV